MSLFVLWGPLKRDSPNSAMDVGVRNSTTPLSGRAFRSQECPGAGVVKALFQMPDGRANLPSIMDQQSSSLEGYALSHRCFNSRDSVIGYHTLLKAGLRPTR